MKAALRVLTALSEHREPDQADLDELHWYAPADRERPIDEVACDAIQRALKEREESRKAMKSGIRNGAFTPDSGKGAQGAEHAPPGGDVSRLLRDYRERRQQYLAVTAKLKRLGIALQEATTNILAVESAPSSTPSEVARSVLESVAGEIDVDGIMQLLNEHVQLTKLLIADQQMLRQHGIQG